MIAKISTGGYTRGAVKYNHDKTIADKKGNVEGSVLTVSNIANDSFDTIVGAINDYNDGNKKVEKPVIHISLNFHKDDILNDEKIVEIAKDYLERLGYKEQPYVIYRHFDREHPHIHIVSSQIDIDGKKINDSHIYYRSQAITRELEEKYSITKAVEKNEIFSKKDIHTAIHEHLEFGKHSLLAIMKRVLQDVMEQKPTSGKQLDYYLEQYQIKRILNKNDANEIIGNSFALHPLEYFNDPSHGKINKGFKGTDVNFNFSYQSINSQIESNEKEKKAIQTNVMGRIYSVINPIINFEKNRILEQNTDVNQTRLSDLILDLRKKGVNLKAKRTQTGDNINVIYGLLFEDIKSSQTFTASDIKLHTKDFLKTIYDDLKDKPKEELDKFESLLESNSENENNKGEPAATVVENLSTFDFLIGILGGKTVGSSGQELSKEDNKKKKKKRKKGL